MASEPDNHSEAPGRSRAEVQDDDAWFDGAARDGERRPAMLPDVSRDSSRRTTRMPLILGALIIVLVLIGLVTGAFSSPSEPPPQQFASRDLEALRASAKKHDGLEALDDATLFKGLDRVIAAMPPPAPALPDATTSEADVAPVADDVVAVAVAEPIETGTTVIAEPKIEPTKPKVTEPKVTEPKVTEPKVTEPKVTDPKAVDPKVTDPKVVDPKLAPPGQKSAVDEAFDAAKTAADGKRWAEAKGHYDKALSLSPGNVKALMGRGRASFELRQLDAAAADLKAVLAADPRHPSALQLLGSIAQEQGRRDEARALYQRYLDAWPNGRSAEQIRAILERL
ncbi:MAG: tetratricopeptide repeat protein [Myxococcota bacterium]